MFNTQNSFERNAETGSVEKPPQIIWPALCQQGQKQKGRFHFAPLRPLETGSHLSSVSQKVSVPVC